EPQDRPSNGLRSLPLVVPQRLLVARVLLPLPLLAADLGGVLLALHNGVPLCSGPDSVGNSLVDDVLQCHTALTSGLPGTSWHSTHRGSYTSSPPGRMTGLSHGAGLPSISRWVRVAGAPQRAEVAASNDTESAIASAQVMAGNSMARKSVSNPATMIVKPQDNTEGTSCRMSAGSKNCASSMATSVPSLLCANAVKMSSAEATGVACIDVPLRLSNCAPSLSAPSSCTKTLVSRPSACACRTSRISSAVFPLRIGPVMTWRPITSHPPLNPTLAQPRPSGTPVRDRRYANGSADTNGPRLVQTRHRLGGAQPPAPRCGPAAPERSLESSPVESPALTTCRAQPLLRYGAAPASAQASGPPLSLHLRHHRQPKHLPNPQSPRDRKSVV